MTYGTPNAPGSNQQQPGGPWRPPPRPPHRWRNRLLIAGGIVVVLIIVLVVVGLTTGSNPQPTAAKCAGLVHLRFGQKAELCSGWTSDGIVSATMYSLQLPFTSQTLNHADAGDDYALGRVQVCAGSSGADTSQQLVAYPFELVFSGNQTTGALDAPDAAKEPDLGSFPSTLKAGQCRNGYVTFEYPTNSKPLSVAWGNPNQPAYEWSG